MKKALLIILFILFLPIAFSQQNDFNNFKNLEVKLNIDGNFTLEPVGERARMEEVNVLLTFVPQNDVLQKTTNLNTYSIPPAKTTKSYDVIEYKWTYPNFEAHNFGIESEVSIRNAIVVIDKKVKFPIENLDVAYKEPTEFIDITPEIREIAESIAGNEDDLYVVAFKAAKWVEENVEYDLNTLTAEAVQKSSWVLENKQGVCDELTNLFISIMRSLGVPARFVSGVAYTNIGNRWGPHGWAEVYFPNKGWVPFDVTYKQFGWIDPSHIKLKANEDSGDPTVRYVWRSYNSQLVGKEINLSAEFISKGEKISTFPFIVRPLINNVGPGSYVPVEVEIANDKNYYFPITFTVTKAPELKEENFNAVLLKPFGVERAYWTVKIPKNIDKDYIYKTKIEIENQFHRNESAEIIYSEKLPIVTSAEAEAMIKKAEREAKMTISKSMELDCTAPNYAFTYEKTVIKCSIKNIGNKNLETVKVCYDTNNCLSTTLGIKEEKNIEFSINLEKGIYNLEFTSAFNGDHASDIVPVNVLEDPDLRISNIEYPNKAKYKDEFNISMILAVNAPVKNIKIKINEKPLLNIESLDAPKSLIIKTSGKEFTDQKEIIANLDFEDLNNKDYSLEFSYPIEITDIPWYVRALKTFGIEPAVL